MKAVEHVFGHAGKLPVDCINLPEELDDEIAALQLAAMGVKYDTMTPEQEAYMKSWKEGHDL